jgi:hypothetical protein
MIIIIVTAVETSNLTTNILTKVFYSVSVSSAESRGSALKQATTASFHILSNSP